MLTEVCRFCESGEKESLSRTCSPTPCSRWDPLLREGMEVLRADVAPHPPYVRRWFRWSSVGGSLA